MAIETPHGPAEDPPPPPLAKGGSKCNPPLPREGEELTAAMRRTARFERFSHSQRLALDAGRNLVIRANAGSGKTSVLIERIVQILARSRHDHTPLNITDIAAITFTRKAGAELQDRLLKAFEQQEAIAEDAFEKAFWAKASRDLSRATIGTIDSLCGKILREFHWELRGDERIEVDYQPLDPYDQNLFEQEAIDRVINRSGDSVDGVRSPEQIALDWWGRREGFKVLSDHLLELLHDPVEPERIVAAHRDQPSIEERCRQIWDSSPGVKLLSETREALQDSLREIVGILGDRPRNTTLAGLSGKCRALLGLLADAGQDTDSLEQLTDILLTADKEPRKMRNFKDVEPQLVALQDIWTTALQEPLVELDGEAHAMQAADHLACLLGPVHAEYQALCREANRYDFSTIARHTRHLLQSSPKVCAKLRRRYRYVMVDEFQDTNPLQWDILSFIVGDGRTGLLDRDRLCIVGDPQQSIFRFRQADVRVFQQVHERIVASNRQHGLAQVPMAYDSMPEARASTAQEREGFVVLAENYRTLSPLPLMLMDEVFRYAFDPDVNDLHPDVDTFEIRYQHLEAGLKEKACGEVRYLFADADDSETADAAGPTSGEETLPDEDLVEAQVEAVADEFVRLWGTPRLVPGDGASATLRWRDMAVLLPSRTTTLSALESALRRRRIPFVVFGGIGFWQCQEIRDLVHLASWLADPGDELALFVILRSPLVQLNDSEIFFVSQKGRGSLWRGLQALARPDDSGPDKTMLHRPSRRPEPAGLTQALELTWEQFAPERRASLQEASARLRRWRERTDRMGHTDLLQRALEESGAYALYAVLPEGEQILANLRQFFDRVRAEEARSALGLSRLARRLRRQVDDFDREGQANLTTSDDAVQVMTVHAAKGLEFPVVAVLKMEGSVAAPPRSSLMVEDQGLGPNPVGTLFVSVRHPKRPLQTFNCQGLTRLRKLDQRQEIAEKRRLFYVAGTRASERLILAGRATKNKRPMSWQTWFEDALNIQESDRLAGYWEDPAKGWRLTIVKSSSARTPVEMPAEDTAGSTVDLESIVELSQTPLVAATQLQRLREISIGNAQDWWLRYRVHLDPAPKPAGEFWEKSADLTPRDRGALVGQLVHRMLMLGDDILELAPKVFDQRLIAMGAALLEPAIGDDESDQSGADPLEIEAITGAARKIFARLRKTDRDAEAIRQLMRAPGKTETPFALALGRWVVRGRFDKLIAAEHSAGYHLVDWKTGLRGARDGEERYRAQMLLYALALARSGQAARIDGGIQVQLVFLETAEIKPLHFNDETLRAFGSEIEADLLKTDAFNQSLEAAGRAKPRESDGR